MLRIGIIGAGFGTVGLLPAFKALKGCRVVAVCTERTQWRALLKRDDLDAVAIATPPRAQYQIAKAALQKGLHVFAEKPLAANVKQAKELLALARKKGVTHGIDFLFPEIAEWKKVKQLLTTKKFGKLVHVSVRWEWLSGDIRLKRWSWRTRRQEGGGALAFYFSHGLNYLEHFAGALQSTQTLFEYAPGNPNDGESGFDMLLRFKNGVVGNVRVSSNVQRPPQHELVFTCERGVIVLKNQEAVVDNFVITTYSAAGKQRVKVAKDKQRGQEDERAKIVRILAKRFVAAATRGRQTHPSFADGLRVQTLIDRIM